MNIGKTLDKWAFIHHTARCPDCEETVRELTNGTYLCDDGHVFWSKGELDGVRWWHGTMPFSLFFIIIMLTVIVAAFVGSVKRLITSKTNEVD